MFHQYGKRQAARWSPISDQGVNERAQMEERDKRFIRALAEAFQRGDHIPANQPKELRLIG